MMELPLLDAENYTGKNRRRAQKVAGHHRKGLSILFRRYQHLVVMTCFLRHFVEIQSYLNKMDKPFIETHSPQSWGSFNMLGEFDFSDEKLQDTTGVLPPPKKTGQNHPENWGPQNR